MTGVLIKGGNVDTETRTEGREYEETLGEDGGQAKERGLE